MKPQEPCRGCGGKGKVKRGRYPQTCRVCNGRCTVDAGPSEIATDHEAETAFEARRKLLESVANNMRMKATEFMRSNTPETTCQRCRFVSNKISGLDTTEPPDIGDSSLCMNCGTISIITQNEPVRTRLATAVEEAEILASECGDTIRQTQILIAGK